MRIAYVCADPGVPVFGRKGASVHVQEVVRALAASAEVVLFAARMEGARPAGMEHVAVRSLPNGREGDLVARERGALAANAFLREALARHGPFDAVYERYSLWSHAGMEFARDASVPGLLEVNAPLVAEQAEHRRLSDRAAAERVASRVFGAATWLLAVSDGVAEHLERSPEACGRVHVLPNGVDPERFRPRPRRAVPAVPRPFTVGFVGSLKPWHGLEVLVAAFALLHGHDPSSRLLVVGDGPGREPLEAGLKAHGLLGAATLTGSVDSADVPRLLASMDAAVAPYPSLARFYFSPLKLYEYMAAGLPVVASAVGQVAEMIEHRRTGLLCPPGDPLASAAALIELQADPGLRLRLGRQARAQVLRRHSWRAVADRILELAAPSPARVARAGAG